MRFSSHELPSRLRDFFGWLEVVTEPLPELIGGPLQFTDKESQTTGSAPGRAFLQSYQ